MDPPPGFVVKRHEDSLSTQEIIIWAKHSIRVCSDKFSKVVIKFGFNKCHVDHTVFVKRKNTKVVMLVFHVDDTENDADEIIPETG